MNVTAVDAAGGIITVVDDKGETSKVEARLLEPKDKKHRAKSGNPVELNSQSDGGTVAIKEKEEGYVKAQLRVAVQGTPAGTEVQIKALDYTSKSDGESIDVILPNKKLASVKKSDVKLFEAGVYNSETDINNNPKTDENKPDEVTGKMDNVLVQVENAIAQLQELKITVDDGTSFSSEAIEKCITELTTYKNSLEQERETSNAATPAA